MKVRQYSLLAALAAAAGLCWTAAAAQTVRAGIEAWQRSDYAAAVAIWRPLAEKGDADAAFNLAQAYRLGRGADVDLAAAKHWLERAARADHLDAQTTLGLVLFDGGSRESALEWLRKAAERGEPRALLVYGTALFNGEGAEHDPVRGYAYVSRAAAQGLEPAKTTLMQLDRIMPIEQRRVAVAIAGQKGTDKPELGEKPAPRAVAPAAVEQAQSAPPATTPAPAKRGWRIQLGAFSKRSSAEALYRRLAQSEPVSGHQPFYIAAGAVTRLQVGPFASGAAANAACAALSKEGHDCFPVEMK